MADNKDLTAKSSPESLSATHSQGTFGAVHHSPTDSKSAAVAGAQAVADAVGKVAAAAVAAVQQTQVGASERSDFAIIGTVGGKFQINGAGMGTGGTIIANGKQADITAWGSTRIEGTLPDGLKRGDQLVVHVDDKTSLVGRFAG